MCRKQLDITLTDDQMELVNQYIPYAERVAAKIHYGDDVTLSEAYYGLIYLASRYNEDSGAKFGTFIKNYLYKRVRSQLYRANHIEWDSDSIVNLQSVNKDYELTYEEILPSTTYNVTLDEMHNTNAYKAVTEKLNKKQKEVFDLYISGLTMQEIGDILGKTRQAISLTWKKALDIIKQDYTYEYFMGL